jgi:chemotaxis receptor (MCP) glutamine deamidase CheD
LGASRTKESKVRDSIKTPKWPLLRQGGHCFGVRDARFQHALIKNRTTIYVGDVAASLKPAVLHTLLGSCVAVCLYDPVLCAGGLNHILLPKSDGTGTTTRFGVHAMELLINNLMSLGGEKRRFIAKAFGGANMFPGGKGKPVGRMNADFVHEFLMTEGIPLVAERLGGHHAVHLYFQTDSGKASLRTVNSQRLQDVIKADRSHSLSSVSVRWRAAS